MLRSDDSSTCLQGIDMAIDTSAIAHQVAARFAFHKIGTIVIRDIPARGWAWGWFANGLEPRMAIEPMDVEHRRSGRVYLETSDGQRAFEPAGDLRGVDLDRLRQAVEANRLRIESAWITTMCYKGWLHLTWDRALRNPLKIVAYSGTPNQRFVELPYCWPDIIGNRVPVREDIAMDRSTGTLILGATDSRPVKVTLAPVLWPREPIFSNRAMSPHDPRVAKARL